MQRLFKAIEQTYNGDKVEHTIENEEELHELIKSGKKINYLAQDPNGIGISERHGSRTHQEDRVLAFTIPDDCSKLTAKDWKHIFDATNEGLEEVVEKNLKEFSDSQGSCLLTTVTIGNNVFVSNIGDSSAFVVKTINDGSLELEANEINQLHKPNVKKEKRYIQKHNGLVLNGRLFGSLAVSRAIGDTEYGEFIRHSGDTYHCTVPIKDDEKAFVVTACDGLMETNTNSEKHLTPIMILNLFNKVLKYKNQPTAHMAARLTRHAIVKNGSTDNVSALVTPIDPKNLKARVACVFDGHSGSKISEYLYQHYEAVLLKQIRARLQQVNSTTQTYKPTQ